ncbi:MAG: DUF2306 domain-containing protein [Crocinitomix sp.]|nr:DUF2306 domain-containing protein [Crocinitomix sp.]
MKKGIKYLLWAIVAVLAINLVLIAASYMTFDPNHKFLNLKQHLIGNPIYRGNFYVHLAFGIVAVITGFALFFDKFIRFSSKRHKQFGKLYIISILLLTGPTGLYLSFFAEGGWLASIGFILMSGMWMLITYIAFSKILKGDIRGHYKWMIRSYCFTLSGITLRLMTPLCVYWFGMDTELTFILTAYLPWIFNLLLGEVIIYFNQNSIQNVNLLLKRTR